MRATVSAANERMLLLFGTTEKGHVRRETVRLERCRESEEHARKPRPLYDFKRVSFEVKVRLLGRYGITDVSCSAPFERVDARHFKPEGCHIQLWLTLLEQAFPRLVGYSPELLHTLFSERAAPEDVEEETAKQTVPCEFRAPVLEPGRHLFPVHCP